MALILTSDKTITNPSGFVEYITKYGSTNKYLSKYVRGTASEGYDLTQGEFNALNTLTNSIVAEGIDSYIMELHPFLGGSNLNANLVKLFGENKLVATSGFSTTNLDGKGVVYPTFHDTNAPALLTGIKMKDAYNGKGLGVMTFMRPTYRVNTFTTIFGAGNDVAVPDSASIAVTTPMATPINRFLNSQPQLPEGIPGFYDGPNLLTAWNRVTGSNIDKRTIRNNKSLIFNGDSVIALNKTPALPEQLFTIGATNSLLSGTVKSWYGELRTVCLFAGDIPEAKVIILENLIDAFVTAVGKKIF